MNMQTSTTYNKKTDWTDLKSKIKARFGKLTDDSVDAAKDDLDLLSAKLQSAYGYAKEHAEKELSAFKATLSSVEAPKKADVDPATKVVSSSPAGETPVIATPAASKVA